MPVARVLTHRRTDDTGPALAELQEVARERGWTLRLDADEVRRHGLTAGSPVEVRDDDPAPPALCVVLGGDGTILAGLRRFAGSGVPVLAVNFGEIGFLAAVEPEDCREGFERATQGGFERVALPAVVLEGPDGAHHAINDVSIHRKVGARVAQLAYTVADQEVGSVRCDGLVVATPVGSTGYNLANGGPVLAWGVEGFVVSFIAPHSLTARALVVAPADELTVHNRSRGPVDVSVDGRPVGELGPGEGVAMGFQRDAATLAQMPGSSFYRRLREKFGRLSS